MPLLPDRPAQRHGRAPDRRADQLPDFEWAGKAGENYGIKDGDWLRVSTRRGSYVGRAQIDGARSKVRPARDNVQVGMIFSPWNLSVADFAELEKNQWLVNETSHRGWYPVSGQADFKKLAAWIEKIRAA